MDNFRVSCPLKIFQPEVDQSKGLPLTNLTQYWFLGAPTKTQLGPYSSGHISFRFRETRNSRIISLETFLHDRREHHQAAVKVKALSSQLGIKQRLRTAENSILENEPGMTS